MTLPYFLLVCIWLRVTFRGFSQFRETAKITFLLERTFKGLDLNLILHALNPDIYILCPNFVLAQTQSCPKCSFGILLTSKTLLQETLLSWQRFEMATWVGENFLEMNLSRFINSFLQMGKTRTGPRTPCII